MDCAIMRDMLSVLPCKGTTLYTGRTLGDTGGMASSRQTEIDVWMQAYADPAFLWRYVRHIDRNGLKFPEVPLVGPLRYFYKAYLYETGQSNDHSVMAAIGLYSSTLPQTRHRRDIIRACIMSDGSSLAASCQKAGLDPTVIDAYEALFYNVSMRVNDALHKLGMAYPDGKMVEWYDGYVKEAGFGELLVRAGYSNGLDDVLMLAGLKEGKKHWKRLSEDKTLPATFEAMVITNSYVLARNGFGGQAHHNAPAVSAGRGMITAAKAGGIDTTKTNSENPMISLFSCFAGEATEMGKKRGQLNQERIKLLNISRDKTSIA